MCYTNILQMLDCKRHSAACGRPYERRTRSSSAEAPVPTIRSLWRSSSICSISEKGRPSTICSFWICYKRNKQNGGKEPTGLSGDRRPRFRASMCRCFMMWLTTRMAPLASVHPSYTEGIPATITKQLVMDMNDVPNISEKPVVPYIKGYPGPCGSGDPARLHPWLPFLPGRQHVYRPLTGAQLGVSERTMPMKMLKSTGHEEISLSSLSSSDYSQLEETGKFSD